MSFPDEKITVIPMGYKIKSKGVYNLEDLYGELQLWFTHMDYKWHEVEYKKIGFPGGGYRLELVWIATKSPDDYVSYEIQVVLGVDASDVEVTLDGGQKVKRQKATLEFRCGSEITKKVKYFEGKPLGEFQAKLYEYMIRPRLRQHEADLWAQSHKLFDELKAFMMLYPH